MTRLRYNGLSTTLGASLTTGATTVTFGAALTYAGGTSVPTIASPDYLPLILRNTADTATTEVVYLTAYTSGTTTGTITRAQEGYAAATHASGDKVQHGVTAQDFLPAMVTGLLGSVEATASANYVTSTTADADVDATNLAITFIAPASGKVIVEQEAVYQLANSSYPVWSVREGTTTLASVSLGQVGYDRGRVSMNVSGLVPGSTHTFKWGFARLGTTGTVTIYAGGNSGTLGNPIMRVYDAGTSGGVGTTTPVVKTRTSGGVTISSTTFVAVDTGLDITLAANVGDTITAGADFRLADSNTQWLYHDIGTVVGGTVVNRYGGAEGIGGGMVPSGVGGGVSLSMPRVVTAADITDGTVTVRLLAKILSGSPTRTIQADTTSGLIFWAKNESANVKTIPTGDNAWTAPTLQNSWVNVGGTKSTFGFRKDGQNVVHFKGRIKSGSSGSTICVLPVGYRPAGDVAMPVAADSFTVAGLYITAATGVTTIFWTSNNNDFGLDGCSFYAEA